MHECQHSITEETNVLHCKFCGLKVLQVSHDDTNIIFLPSFLRFLIVNVLEEDKNVQSNSTFSRTPPFFSHHQHCHPLGHL